MNPTPECAEKWLPVMYDLRLQSKGSQSRAAAAAAADAEDEPFY
jgi:hypothetical protein